MALDAPIDIAALPAILVGPILRRLTRTQISVWVLLSKPDNVSLHVQSQDGSGAVSIETATPTRIGEHVYIALITTDGIDANEFTANKLYQYWLTSAGWGAAAPNWANFTLESLDFPAGPPRPTFLGIPDTVDKFRVLHISCRKAHGNKRDGLVHALSLLNTANRPCLLLMSGDQIYSDDVASPLAPRIKRIDSDLFNIDESDLFGALPPIAGRQEPTDGFGFTGDASKDHLWTLGEFYALYILAWSDVLWPAAIPSLADADLGEVSDKMTDEIWQHESENLQLFRDTLPSVRIILANTPVLMIFDDHEITDDWGLNYSWIKNVFKSDAGRRVMANGLLAYTLFQHWGNEPIKFATVNTAELLTLTAATWSDNSSPQDVAMLRRLSIPDAGSIPDSVPDAGYEMRNITNDNLIRYDFRVLADQHGYPMNLVFLDERTARFFAEDDKPPGRISIAALDVMWPEPTGIQADTPTLLIAPAPILGLTVIEHVLQPLLALKEGGAEAFDFESWSAWGSTFEHLLHRVGQWKNVVALSGDVHFGYTKLLEYRLPHDAPPTKMAQFVASGAKNAETKTIMLHIFADALTKLGIIRTHAFNGYTELSDAQKNLLEQIPPAGTALIYDDLVDVLMGRVLRDGLEKPAVLATDVANAYSVGTPDWAYTISHIDDETQTPAGNLLDAMNAVTGPGFPWEGWDRAKSIAMVRALRASDLHRIGRVIVGLPQLSLISFPNAVPFAVRQELYSMLGNQLDDEVAMTVTELELA